MRDNALRFARRRWDFAGSGNGSLRERGCSTSCKGQAVTRERTACSPLSSILVHVWEPIRLCCFGWSAFDNDRSSCTTVQHGSLTPSYILSSGKSANREKRIANFNINSRLFDIFLPRIERYLCRVCSSLRSHDRTYVYGYYILIRMKRMKCREKMHRIPIMSRVIVSFNILLTICRVSYKVPLMYFAINILRYFYGTGQISSISKLWNHASRINSLHYFVKPRYSLSI